MSRREGIIGLRSGPVTQRTAPQLQRPHQADVLKARQAQAAPFLVSRRPRSVGVRFFEPEGPDGEGSDFIVALAACRT